MTDYKLAFYKDGVLGNHGILRNTDLQTAIEKGKAAMAKAPGRANHFLVFEVGAVGLLNDVTGKKVYDSNQE